MKINAINNNFTNLSRKNNQKSKQNSTNFEYTSHPISFNGGLFPQELVIARSIPEQVQEIAKSFGEKLHKIDVENIEHIFRKNQNVGEKNKPKSLTLEEIANIYIKKLQRTKIISVGNGIEQGLNKIAGLTDLKAKMYSDFLSPLCEVLDGKHKHMFVPNGMSFFGPKGSGTTSFARALGEHYTHKGGYFEEIKLTGDKNTDLAYLKQKFAEAKERFEQSENKKYTIFLFDEIEKMLDSKNPTQRHILCHLLTHANNCKDNGAIFMSTVENFDNLEKALYRCGRTDWAIPILYVRDCDMPNIINHFAQKNNLALSSDVDFVKILEAIKSKQLQYKASDIDKRLSDGALKHVDSNTIIGTDEIIEVLTRQGPIFNEEDCTQFKKAKEFIRDRPGSVYGY